MGDRFQSARMLGRELFSAARTPFLLNSALSQESADEAIEVLEDKEFRIENPEFDIQDKDVDKEIVNYTGLETPGETVKLVYNSGMQMETDFTNISEEALVEFLSQNIDFPVGRLERALLALSGSKSAVNSFREVNDMMGANQLMLDSDLKLENRNQFAVCPSTIEKAYPESHRQAAKYTEIHEKVHAAQFQNYQIEEELGKRQAMAAKEEGTAPVDLLMTTIESHAMYFGDKIADDIYDIDLGEVAQSMLTEDSEGKEEQYYEGEDFIESLHQAGGAGLANHALRRPPETRDQINNPKTWYQERADSDILRTYWGIDPEDVKF